MKMIIVLICKIALFIQCTNGWVPPGMSNTVASEVSTVNNGIETHLEQKADLSEKDHDHSKNIDLGDLVVDIDHLSDDLGDMISKDQLKEMVTDEKVFTWFSSHDWSQDKHLDGLELVKSLSHEHNYHHHDEESNGVEDNHDPAQHTATANKQRFKRTVKIVDTLLANHDPNKDGLLSFPEFMTAYHSGKLDGLKLRKIKE